MSGGGGCDICLLNNNDYEHDDCDDIAYRSGRSSCGSDDLRSDNDARRTLDPCQTTNV